MNYESAEERFFIMTENSDVDDLKAIKYIQDRYGKEIAVKLWEKYCGTTKKEMYH